MAIIQVKDKKIEVPDGLEGEALVDVCSQLGIIFGCQEGTCGTCQVKIDGGAENLSKLSEDEIEAGLGENIRRMCVCKIIKGTVKLDLYLQDY